MKPLWIIIDGIDGAGKTTLCKNLETALNFRNDTEVIHLPYEHAVAYQYIRELLKDKDQNQSDIIQYNMIANYRDTLKNFIIPMLKKGTNVILDRWITSTIAYNLYDNGNLMIELGNLSWMMSHDVSKSFMAEPRIMNVDIIHNMLTTGIDLQGYKPDVLIYLIPNQDIVNAICQKRKEEESEEVNDVDCEKMAKINKIFSNMAEMSTISIPYKNSEDMAYDIKFGYNDISKVFGITEESDKIEKYYMTLFPNAMEVIHQILENTMNHKDSETSTFQIEPQALCLNTTLSDPCAIFDNQTFDETSCYDE